MISVFLNGFFSGGGLIVAIGAQNAFVLSNGIRKNHVIIVPLVCFLCDAVFISIGCLSVGLISDTGPIFDKLIRLAGGLFLLFYSTQSFMSLFKKRSFDDDKRNITSIKKVILSTFMVTLLNPHFYLDTVFLLGSISSRFETELRPYFTIGAVSASFLWFFTLSVGAGIVSPFFKNDYAWKFLDLSIGLIMLKIGFNLLWGII